MARIGYARVSSIDQDLNIQIAKLKAEGCEIIRSEKVSGGSREGRVELETVIQFLRPGDEMMVARLDRLGRDTRDVLNVIHECEQRQAFVTVLEPSITFRDIHELSDPAGRVVMMEIPAAPRGLPIAWKGHYYARAGESLVSLGIDKQDEIRNQTLATDWTAQMVPGATLGHLDPAACARARDNFALKNPHRIEAEAISDWPLEALLARAKLTKDGKLIRMIPTRSVIPTTKRNKTRRLPGSLRNWHPTAIRSWC